jgi:hypothetical protein
VVGFFAVFFSQWKLVEVLSLAFHPSKSCLRKIEFSRALHPDTDSPSNLARISRFCCRGVNRTDPGDLTLIALTPQPRQHALGRDRFARGGN